MILKKFRALRRLMPKGKAMFLAYDQGIEHGPTDFNDKNVDPNYIIWIAQQGKYSGIIFQKGIAEQYHKEIKKSGIPLIVKLNGKSGLVQGEPVSRQLCTVEEALELGATAVGYTIYLGSEHEEIMLREFEDIQRVAHYHEIPVIAWIYPRGKGTQGKSKGELLAYAARLGLELGADIVKLHWEGNLEELAWAVKAAGRTKIVIAGGKKAEEEKILDDIRGAINVGVSGIAIGRNAWQATNPLELTQKIKKIIWKT